MRALTLIAPVILGVGFAQFALGLMATLIPLLLLRQNLATGYIGLIASMYFAGFLAGALSGPRIVAHLGHIRAFTVMAAISALVSLLMTVSGNPWLVAVARLAIGYACSVLFLVTESWINDRADSSTRGRFFGVYLVMNWGSSAAGPLLLGVIEPALGLYALTGALFAAALLPMALTAQSNPQIRPGRRLSLRELFVLSPVGLTCSLAAGLLNSSYYSLMPVYLAAHGFDAQAVSSFASIVLIAALLVQLPIGYIADRIERRRLTLIVLTLAMLASLALALVAGSNFPAIVISGCIIAASMSPLYGLGAGQTNDRLERGDYVAAAGGLLFVWSVGAAIGPSLAGVVMGQAGPGGLFLYMCVTLALVAGFVMLRMRARADVPVEQQSGYVPRATLSPRLDETAVPAAPAEPE
jgi:MFS family permease